MIVLGLTGSIGMGKTTVAAMFEQLGVPAHDSDAAVHELMAPGSKGHYNIAAAFPYYSYPQIYDRKTKTIKREELGRIVFKDPQEREKLEQALHPLVRAEQMDFMRAQTMLGRDMVVLDIPLLFETGADEIVDYTLCVSAPYHVQTGRVLSRENMSQEKFEAILKRQMPTEEKCERADYTIQTGLNRAHTLQQVKDILRDLRQDRKNHARNRSGYRNNRHEPGGRAQNY